MRWSDIRRRISEKGRSVSCGLFVFMLSLALLPGCFTVSETEPPAIGGFAPTQGASNVTVTVRGFQSALTEYVYVGGYQTYYTPPHWHGGWWGGGYHTAYSSYAVPQARVSDFFGEQARNRFESMGFAIMAQRPDFIVEGRFEGPYSSGSDAAKSICWIICSLFTCDHAAVTWVGKVKVYDNRTGRLVWSGEYPQRYEVTGFSPIPLLGISHYDRTSSNYTHGWCLNVLTDRMCSEASAAILRMTAGR